MLFRSHRTRIVSGLAPVMAVLLGAAVAMAGGPPPGWPSGVWPYNWNRYEGQGSNRNYGAVPNYGVVPAAPAPVAVVQSPSLSTLKVYQPPYQHTEEDPNRVYLVAHVPTDAQVSIWGYKPNETGTMRTLRSPTVPKGQDFYYDVTVRWHEKGAWVTQTAHVSVRAGGTYCVDVIDTDSQLLEKDIAAALAELSPEDAALARQQRTCPIQEGVRLGSMGAPVKMTLKGETVFFCCPACEPLASKNPDQVLQTVHKLREKNSLAVR